MRDELPFFLAMFALTAIVEFFVLHRWHGRWGFPACILSVAIFSGGMWLASWILVHWNDNVYETEDPPTIQEIIEICSVAFFVFTIIALMPAGITAFIYRKLRIKRRAISFPPAERV